MSASPRCSRAAVERVLVQLAREAPQAEVLRDLGQLEAYAHDASEVEPVLPDAVVRARHRDEVAALLRAAHQARVPVTPRAGGSGRVGGAVPLRGGIVLSVEKMQALVDIDVPNRIAVVQPGVITGALHQMVEQEGLFYPPDPNSLEWCAIGGNLACNAGGPRAFKYGVTRNYMLGLQAVTGDGTLLELGKRTLKGVTGYDLAALMVGSEGTLAVITEATLRLVALPESVVTLLAFLPDDAAIGRAVCEAMPPGLTPRCMELLDSVALDIVRQDVGLAVPSGAKAMLLVELDGTEAVLEADMERCGNALLEAGAVDVLVAQSAHERERLWAARRQLSDSTRKLARCKLSEDVVVPRTELGGLLLYCQQLADRHRLLMPTYGHAGDGNLHVNFLWNDAVERPRVDAAIQDLFTHVIARGGTLSGEHGIGVLKAPYLPLEQSPALIAMQQRVKTLFDPRGVLNPGKIFPAGRRGHGVC
ncbi:MAG: FAD-binding oxidoreductase [Polyangiales bacterium]